MTLVAFSNMGFRICAVGLAVASSLLPTVSCANGTQRGGEEPAIVNDGGHGTAGVAVAGEVVTTAQLFLPNRSSSPVTIKSIEVVQGDPGLEVVGVALAGSERTVPVSYTREEGFPPSEERFGPAYDVHGYVIDPAVGPDDLGPLVMIGLRVPDASRSSVIGATVVYEHESRRYEETFVSTAAFCVDPTMAIGACPLDYGPEGGHSAPR